MRLSFLADQVGSGTGGSRFASGYLQTILANLDNLDEIDVLYIVTTQQENTEHLPLYGNSSRIKLVSRRFPARLRHSTFANLMHRTLPDADIAHGGFYYVFPKQAKYTLFTMHDLSILWPEYHPEEKRRDNLLRLASVVQRSTAIVCSSNATVMECQRTWPRMKHKFHRVYLGTEPLLKDRPITEPPRLVRELESYILTVGTIEPRKNYPRILDAYQQLLNSDVCKAPALVIIGRKGWMCDETIERIRHLQKSGKVFWLNNVNDDDLAHYYANASVFTYPSTCEGFGYPPFEAAYAEVPIVVSNVSSIGEIWNSHAYTVNPLNVGELVAGWQWALKLDENQRREVTWKQLKRAREFTWSRCVTEHMSLYRHLLKK